MRTLDRAALENLISEAYEIGYAHGGNAARHERCEPPVRAADGWEPIVDKVLTLFAAATPALTLEAVQACRKKWEAAHPGTVQWAVEFKTSYDAVRGSYLCDENKGADK